MPKRPIEWIGVVAFCAVAILVAVLFDSPVSVWILVGLVFVGVGISYTSSKAKRNRAERGPT